jgi:hypothetical protein
VLASAYDYDEPDENIKPEDKARDASFYLDLEEETLDAEERTATSTISNGLSSSRSSSFDDPRGLFDNVGDSVVEGLGGRPSRSQQPQVPRHQHQQPSSSMWNRTKTLVAMAAQRHRKRRYEVLSKLLISSSELLLLERGVAKAFLPMLTAVLVPQPMSKKRSRKTSGTNNNGNYDVRYAPRDIDEDDLLRPFLESLTPGSGVRCLSLLLLQYLLTSDVGYDARIRHAIKSLGVIVLVYEMKRDPVEQPEMRGLEGQDYPISYKDWVARATRKFESLEHSIARRIIRLSESNTEQQKRTIGSQSGGGSANGSSKSKGLTRQQLLRGVKIGSAGLVAGTLFAVTGGLAAPGIAAGVAAFAGSTAVATAAVVTLTNTVIVTTIFGVGGGGLAAYKMQRRTQGLTEFEFRRESKTSANKRQGNDRVEDERGQSLPIEAELFSTICLSGWLRDRHDYQRPWGIHPTNPRLTDRMELLERFYSIHSPDHVPKCPKILASWKGEENKLWSVLRQKYGRDPDHLFPLKVGPRFTGALTLEQEEVLDQLFVELGYNSVAPNAPGPSAHQPTPFERMRAGWKKDDGREQANSKKTSVNNADPLVRNGPAFDSMHGPSGQASLPPRESKAKIDRQSPNTSFNAEDSEQDDEGTHGDPKHLATVWDYHATYGGELYTIRWESTLLTNICDCVMDLAMDVVSGATRHLLRQTVLSTLFAAITWPAYLINVANMIDGDWTLAVERCDEAGTELAKTLLFSRAGHRPVTLVGFSFGARIIYACLKELAKAQQDWEEYEDLKRRNVTDGRGGTSQDRQRFNKLDKKLRGMREPASIVEDAILMGSPNHLSLLSWKACREIVAGRLVNCFSQKDYMLSLMFQVKRSSVNLDPTLGSVLKPVCGTCPVPIPGVENFDVSDIVSGHQDYCLVTGTILERVRHGQPLRSTECTFEDSADGERLSEAVKQLGY